MCFIDDPLPDSGNIHTKNLQNQSDWKVYLIIYVRVGKWK